MQCSAHHHTTTVAYLIFLKTTIHQQLQEHTNNGSFSSVPKVFEVDKTTALGATPTRTPANMYSKVFT
jgi:hypothetical protein